MTPLINVRSTYKIGIAGAHSTGKSSFCGALMGAVQDLGVEIHSIGDLATEAREIGFPILRDHTFESTAWIMTRGISFELAAGLHPGVIIVDRPVPDALGYLWAALQTRAEQLPRDDVDYLKAIVSVHSRTYDRLIKTTINPGIPIDTAKQRDTEPEFRSMAAAAIDEVFTTFDLPAIELTSDNKDAVLRLVVNDVDSWADARE